MSRFPRWMVSAFAALWLACGTSNGFRNEDYCPSGGCTQCQVDADCVVAVDCCGERNVCLHKDDSIGLCKMACAEDQNPPDVACIDSRCRCR